MNSKGVLVNEGRAKRFLEENDLSALIATSRENTTYLTNFNALDLLTERMHGVMPGSGNNFVQTYGLYSKDGDRVLILPISRYLLAGTDEGVSPEIYTYGRPPTFRNASPRFETDQERELEERISSTDRVFESAGLALSAAVKEFVRSKRVGVDFTDIHDSSRNQLSHDHPDLVQKNAVELFRFIRLVKSAEEVRRLRTAAEINEKALAQLMANIRPGSSEVELRRVFARSVVSEDAVFEPSHFMLTTGTRAAALTAPTKFKLQSGSVGWVDCGCSYGAYHADTGETFALGNPSRQAREYYEALKSVVEFSEKTIIAGSKPSELNREVSKLWDRLGVPKPPSGMGHGLGLEVHEYPRITVARGDILENKSAIKDDLITSSVDIPFEEGMVLALEAPYMMWGWGGVHLETSVILTKGGCEPLIEHKRFLRIIS